MPLSRDAARVLDCPWLQAMRADLLSGDARRSENRPPEYALIPIVYDDG